MHVGENGFITCSDAPYINDAFLSHEFIVICKENIYNHFLGHLLVGKSLAYDEMTQRALSHVSVRPIQISCDKLDYIRVHKLTKLNY